MFQMYWCRHCLGPVQLVDGVWVHADPETGLLISVQCWPTPNAEPMLP